MPILDKNNKEQVERYKNFLKNSEYTRLTQALEWGEVKKEWIQEVVYLEENNNIVAGMTILLEKVPYFNSYLMYAPRGPVCDCTDVEVVNLLMNDVNSLATKYNAFCMKFDPAIKYSKDIEDLYKKNGYITSGLSTDHDRLIQPEYDAVLDIGNIAEDELIKKFSEKTRYNIRLSTRKGVEVYYSNNKEDLKIFYELYKITTIRDKIGCRSFNYFERMLDAYDKEHIRIYIAKNENDYLSAAIAVTYGTEMFYLYGASSNEKRNLMPNYLMQWEMIKWGIEKNCKTYNFGGIINLNKEDGLYKFKTGFCKEEGIFRYIGEINKVYDKKIYFIYDRIFPFVKKIRRKLRKSKSE